MTIGRFRLLVVSWIVVYLWWFSMPFGAYSKYPRYAHEAFSYSGRGAVINPSDDLWWAFLFVEFVVAIGLFGLYNWARYLLLIATLAQLGLRPLLGLGVSTPFIGTLGYGVVLLNGAILAACYSKPLSDAFRQTVEEDPASAGDESEPQPDEQLVCVFESSSAAVIPVVASLLDASGIAYETDGSELQDIIAGGRLAGFNPAVGPVRFLVSPSQSEAARAVLELDDISAS